MRETLFRAKRLGDNGWVDGNLFIDDKGNKHEILVGYVNYRISWEVAPETVGQYTGLTDKNGQRIFEGDIVEVDDFNAEDGYGEVIWDSHDARFAIVGREPNNLLADFSNYCGRDIEIIGNIYDNPELLEGEVME